MTSISSSTSATLSIYEPVKRQQFLPRTEDQKYLSHLLKEKPLQFQQLKQIQARLFRQCLHQDTILVTKLVGAYAASGTMEYARLVFNAIEHPDLFLCNAILRGYTQSNLMQEALIFYSDFVLQCGFFPDHFTLPFALKACTALLCGAAGRGIHAFAVKSGLVFYGFVQNALVGFYAKCGDTESALLIFSRIEDQGLISWNVLLGGLVGCGDMVTASHVFDEMPERDVASWNTMFSGYAKAGDLEAACQVFREMPERNSVSWNAKIAAFVQNGRKEDALLVLSEMVESNIKPDIVTMLTIISVVSSMSNPDKVDWVVGLVTGSEFANSVTVLTAIVNLYAKFGRIQDAYDVFSRIPKKDVVCWNSMIGGFAQNQEPGRALDLFRRMQLGTVKPDAHTMVSVLSACAQLGALGLGEWVHNYVQRNAIYMDVYLGTALVDTYARCGDLNSSKGVFSKMPQRDVASYNAMIRGLAMHGHGSEVLELFSQMEKEGILPNYITFVGLLSACSHEGLVSRGFKLFNSIKNTYKIVPGIEHYGCMVDLLGRAGHLCEARDFIKNMPIAPDSVIWAALLSACRFHHNLELAEEATKHLIALNPDHDGSYVLLSNIYAKARKWEEVTRVRESMRAQGVRKTPGCSSVEISHSVFEFTAGDRSHLQSNEIYAKWNELAEQLKQIGYAPDSSSVLRDILEEEEKEQALYRHSEKLALSFALISTKPGTPIRIVKNLRICADCHRAMELISALVGREITVRDRNRFHVFREGQCSCRGYW